MLLEFIRLKSQGRKVDKVMNDEKSRPKTIKFDQPSLIARKKI